ncbi:hypothetical protein J6Y73_04990 [bacterium]|nr:hypothetical protein [bacterium]
MLNEIFINEKKDIVRDAVDLIERFFDIRGSIIVDFEIQDSRREIFLNLTQFSLSLNPKYLLKEEKMNLYKIMFKNLRIIYQAMEIELYRYKKLFKYYDYEKINLWKYEHDKYLSSLDIDYDFLVDSEAFSILMVHYFFNYDFKVYKSVLKNRINELKGKFHIE